MVAIWDPVYSFQCDYSPVIEAAWSGQLLHLAGLHVIGATVGSLARLVQDREAELWEGKRIVSKASAEEVTPNTVNVNKLLMLHRQLTEMWMPDGQPHLI